MPRSAVVAWCLLAAGLLLLQRGLPAETFVVGDPGVKLIAARNALAHPSRPWEIPLPSVAGTRVDYVEPFFVRHDAHMHAVTPELFPVLTAPFLAMFGHRGLYVLPALGFLAGLVAWAWTAVTLDSRRHPALVILALGLGTPLLFYALEFWEHAPAFGSAAVGTALHVAAWRRERRGNGMGFAAGVFLGLAALLRPEAAWYAAALLIASAGQHSRIGFRWMVPTVAGAVLALAPLVLFTFAHFGTPWNPHVGGNARTLDDSWLAMRSAFLWRWFVEPSTVNFWRVAPAAIAALFLVVPQRRYEGQRLLAMTSAGVILLAWLTAPNDGGSQWGPRYLLLGYGPIAVLGSDALQRAASRGRAGVALVVLTLLAGAWIQRTSYKELRAAKQAYGTVLAFVRENTPAGGFVLTDLWWLDQVAAAASSDRQFLYVTDDRRARSALEQLRQASVPDVTVIVSSEERHVAELWGAAPCTGEPPTARNDVRTLVARQLRLDCR